MSVWYLWYHMIYEIWYLSVKWVVLLTWQVDTSQTWKHTVIIELNHNARDSQNSEPSAENSTQFNIYSSVCVCCRQRFNCRMVKGSAVYIYKYSLFGMVYCWMVQWRTSQMIISVLLSFGMFLLFCEISF